jgi:hypothetical protein
LEQSAPLWISYDHGCEKTPLERAFELARSGKCLSVRDIAYQLHAEKYDIAQLQGPTLRKQLLELIEEATKRHS